MHENVRRFIKTGIIFLLVGLGIGTFMLVSRRHSSRAAYWTLTISTAVRIAGEVARSEADATWLGLAVSAAGAVQILGFAIYFWTMWPRIRPIGSHLREAKGQRF